MSHSKCLIVHYLLFAWLYHTSLTIDLEVGGFSGELLHGGSSFKRTLSNTANWTEVKDTGLKTLGPDRKHQVPSQAGQLCADCFLAQQSTQHTLTLGGFAQSGTGMREGCENGKERMGSGGVTCPFATHRLFLALMLWSYGLNSRRCWANCSSSNSYPAAQAECPGCLSTLGSRVYCGHWKQVVMG